MRKIAATGLAIMATALIAIYTANFLMLSQVTDLGPELSYDPETTKQVSIGINELPDSSAIPLSTSNLGLGSDRGSNQ